jgi:hypothetical protein
MPIPKAPLRCHPQHITHAHWNLVSVEREAVGYNREAYEHVLQLSDVLLEQAVTVPENTYSVTSNPGEAVQVIRIGDVLKDAEMVKEIGGLETMPEIVDIVSKEGVPASLSRASTAAKAPIKEWLGMLRILEPSS